MPARVWRLHAVTEDARTPDSCCTLRSRPQERRLLFSRGVTLHVQAGDMWRPFAMLSGGQQALAALALSFALQVCVCALALLVALCLCLVM